MTIRDALSRGIDILKSCGIETPVLEAGVMLCHVINCERAYLYAHGEVMLGDDEIEQFFRMINQRSLGKPLQYITGHQEFMSLDFVVTSDVLIPRQDTETLVEAVIGKLKPKEHIYHSQVIEPKVLDIGTGSGCIAVSVAYYIKNCRITAVDISEKALEVAELNANNIGVVDKIDFLKSDIFNNLCKGDSIFDVIVSNPPYIESGSIGTLQREVRENEPVLALDGGTDGLDFYRSIIKGAVDFLKPTGILAFEVGFDQARAVAGLMDGKYFDINIIKDLSNIERVVIGQLKN
jgi:release factor glutamine methyltransferase